MSKIEGTLQGIVNIAISKTKPYSFVDLNGKNQCSDKDYTIYNMTRNILLIIETKWIDKHYKDEIDIRYGMLLQTLNGIFEKQIRKHKVYLSNKDNIDDLFKEDPRYIKDMERPQIFYLAVDKRNQLHIDDRHMISEYMLMYFLENILKISNLI